MANRIVVLIILVGAGWVRPAPAAERLPNILLIYTDDLGYGDYAAAGSTRVHTPNIDRLAREGLNFTDAHSSAAVCTPSRFSILTGQYSFRRPDAQVLPGNARLLIKPGTPTLASLMRGAGYATGCVGKWHLGLGDGHIDWNGDIKPGPLEIGFDESFIIPATPDRTPCVYVEGHRVVNLDPADPLEVNYRHKIGTLPTGKDHPELLRYGMTAGHAGTIIDRISRIGFMSGAKAAWWTDETMSATLAERADRFIREHREKPFFLYLATNGIHVPRAPNEKFLHSSTSGLRGDTINELDWEVGQVLDTLDDLKLADNTLVIFSSDNGPVLDDGYADGAVKDNGDQKPAGPFRGGKYTIWEGGTRLPLITRWPGHIRPGRSDALVGQLDLVASLADLVHAPLPKGAAPDSQDVLPALLGLRTSAREHLVEQASTALAVRQGNWKLVPPDPAGSRFHEDGDPVVTSQPTSRYQLYDLSADLGETRNVAADHPDIVKRMEALLTHDRATPQTR